MQEWRDSWMVHPALRQLIRRRAGAHARRLRQRLRTPRRLVLSMLGVLLALFWLGNAAASILWRRAADPEMLPHWMATGLVAYALWHVVKVIYRRPEEGVEWSPAERDQLLAGPFSRRQLLGYRLMELASSAIVKATCFAALLLPDLTIPICGFVGALAALLGLEMWRMLVEITAAGVGDRAYRCLRVLGVLLLIAAASGFCRPLLDSMQPAIATTAVSPAEPAVLSVLSQVGQLACDFDRTTLGRLLTAPVQPVIQIILADRFDLNVLAHLGVACVAIAGLMLAVLWTEGHFQRLAQLRERRQVARGSVEPVDSDGTGDEPIKRLPLAPLRGAWIALVFRQLLGLRHYGGSVMLALVAPIILSLSPLLFCRDAGMTFVHVVGALVFYSLVLLPPALRFDFRSDVDRMRLLKSLPIGPSPIVAAQLTTPVLVASGFQLVILIIVAVIRPIAPWTVIMAWGVLVPVNVLIFALDNLIFLLHPHRARQEGLEVFLRTMLTFSAKAVLFGLAVAVTIAWVYLSRWLSQCFGWQQEATRALFSVGIVSMVAMSACMATWAVVRAYSEFDASQDVPS